MTELQALVRAAQDGDKDAFDQVVIRIEIWRMRPE